MTERTETLVSHGTETVTCRICKGDGMISKYDMGWRSLVHEPALAAKQTCWRCGGRGTVQTVVKVKTMIPVTREFFDDCDAGSAL